MPWRRKAMKDVVSCEKPRGEAKHSVIRGFLNGETGGGHAPSRALEYIKCPAPTQGSETSQYLKEKKSNETPKVAASEMG